MKPVIAIPSGSRTKKLLSVIEAWKKTGFHIAVYTWDNETKGALLEPRTIISPLRRKSLVDWLLTGERKSFGALQNYMARLIPDWEVLICGADDLYPANVELIEAVAKEVPECVIWASDGLLNSQPTHPIITRGWYEKHGREIFDEAYKHNFVDTDLFLRSSLAGDVVDCRSLISFNHMHPMKTGDRKDSLYTYGDNTYHVDESYFHLKFQHIKAIPPVMVLEVIEEEAAV